MFDMLAMAVAALALWAILKDSVPTGIFGSLGLAVIGCASMVAIDDSTFANTERLEWIVIALLVGFLLIFAHVVVLVWRSRTGSMTPKRRASDIGSMARHATKRAQ
jgi:hypothetical protein